MEMSRIRRLLGRFNLLLTGLLAFGIWIAVSVLASRPTLKGLWDVSPQAQFSVTEETEKLLDELRGQEQELVIDTFFPVYPRPRTAFDAHQLQILQRIHHCVQMRLPHPVSAIDLRITDGIRAVRSTPHPGTHIGHRTHDRHLDFAGFQVCG